MNKIIKNYLFYFGAGFILIVIGSFLLPKVATSGGKYGLIFGIIGFVASVLFIILFVTKKMAGDIMSNFPIGEFTGFPFSGKSAAAPDIPNGIATWATITNFQQSGINMSMGTFQYYEMLIDLNVEGTDGTTWPARVKQMVPLAQLNMFQIGTRISVKYDPNDKSKVVFTTQNPNQGGGGASMDIPGYGTINSQTAQAAMQTAPKDITLRVQAAHALFQELAITGVAATATVLSTRLVYENYMNGADVYLLKLMVNATEIPPFEAETTDLMAKSALPKIEPNKTVYVKYDRNNPQRMSLTGTDKPDSAILL